MVQSYSSHNFPLFDRKYLEGRFLLYMKFGDLPHLRILSVYEFICACDTEFFPIYQQSIISHVHIGNSISNPIMLFRLVYLNERQWLRSWDYVECDTGFLEISV